MDKVIKFLEKQLMLNKVYIDISSKDNSIALDTFIQDEKCIFFLLNMIQTIFDFEDKKYD